jgi:hypothetical protein
VERDKPKLSESVGQTLPQLPWQLHMAYDIPTKFHKVWSRYLREKGRTKLCESGIIRIIITVWHCLALKQFYIKNVGPAKIQRVQQKIPGCWTYVQQSCTKISIIIMFWLHLNDHWCCFFFLTFVDFILKKVITRLFEICFHFAGHRSSSQEYTTPQNL